MNNFFHIFLYHSFFTESLIFYIDGVTGRLGRQDDCETGWRKDEETGETGRLGDGGDEMTIRLGDLETRRLGDEVTRWLDDEETGWRGDEVTGWRGDWMTRRLKEKEALLLNKGFFIVIIHVLCYLLWEAIRFWAIRELPLQGVFCCIN